MRDSGRLLRRSIGKPSDMADAEIEHLRRQLAGLEAENAGLRQANPKAGDARDAARIVEEIDGTDNRTDPFAAAVRATRMPMVISNPRLDDNPIVFVNDAFCRLTGYEREEILGRNCRFLQGPDTDRETVASLRAAIETKEPIKLDILNYRKDGETFWNQLLMAPVQDAQGELAYFFASQVDVTRQRERLEGLEGNNAALMAEVTERLREQKQVEAKLRELNETLEQRVEERTSELRVAEEALRQAVKMEAVGHLTGGLAHDFNNLLTGITGALDLIKRRLIQGRVSDIARYAEVATTSAARAAALTHRLLAFSRRQTLDPKPTDVDGLISGMVDLIRRTVGPEVEVRVVNGPDIWRALVDPNQLENALLNLCINARDAMPDGGRLTIEIENGWIDARDALIRDFDAGAYLKLSVSDTGTGMPPEVMARAFDPFFTTKPLGQGTGLGLSMIYGFSKQSGGQVWIHSEVGRGTRVTLCLPRFEGEVRQTTTLVESIPDLPLAEQGETVLLVDDEAAICLLISDALSELGYVVMEAGDGAGGLRILQSDIRIDLLVTDVGLPGGMNGRQVADAARALRPGLKVLFITGYAETAAVGGSHLDAGMAVMTKPFAMDDLGAKIRALIGT